jgi:CheY-like chemotaxis protein
VLLVDDDVDMRFALHCLLEVEGYQVLDAGDGREALAVLASGARPCLVLLDLMMPTMNGWEVLDALRASGALTALPVVLVSAVGCANAPALGARACVTKPVPIPLLLALVEEHCGSPRGPR